MTTPKEITSILTLTKPDSIVLDTAMTLEQKRTLLASWASDARAVVDHPELRRLDNGSLAKIDDITRALKELGIVAPLRRATPDRLTFRRRSRRSKMPWLWRRRNDDDDEPPPTPAGVFPRPPILQGGFAMAA